jgi:hypothetical protein
MGAWFRLQNEGRSSCLHRGHSYSSHTHFRAAQGHTMSSLGLRLHQRVSRSGKCLCARRKRLRVPHLSTLFDLRCLHSSSRVFIRLSQVQLLERSSCPPSQVQVIHNCTNARARTHTSTPDRIRSQLSQLCSRECSSRTTVHSNCDHFGPAKR